MSPSPSRRSAAPPGRRVPGPQVQAPNPKTGEARKFFGGLATVTADLAALGAFTAAVGPSASSDDYNEDFVAAARTDYDTLVRLRLGHYPEAGAPVDPSSGGPLGPL